MLKKSDLLVTRFRLPHEDLRHAGSGCLVHHKSTQKVYVADAEQPFPLNKKDALGLACSDLGITEEDLKQQQDAVVFPDWITTQLYHRKYDAFSITVFFLRGEEDPEMEGWTWGIDDEEAEEYDPGLYVTPEGAIRAAEKWATGLLSSKNDPESDSEGERSTESPK